MTDPNDYTPQFAVGDRVRVEGEDFIFDGTVICFGAKRSGRISYTVENYTGIVHTYSRRLMRLISEAALSGKEE